MAIEWHDDFKTGVEKIDKQHCNLFRFINDLELEINKGLSSESISATLRFLETYIKKHFEYEEICMTRAKCPIAQKNQDAHRAFIIYLEEYKERLRVNGASLQNLKELHGVLESWTKNHICKIDVMLGRKA